MSRLQSLAGKFAVLFLLLSQAVAAPWPYTRTFTNETVPLDEHNDEIPDLFLEWLKGTVKYEPTGALAASFVNGTIPDDVHTLEELEKYAAHHHKPASELYPVVWDSVVAAPENLSTADHAALLFSHLNFALDPICIGTKESFWYRQPDGACNWIKEGESHIGRTSYPRSRDYDQTTYSDGISTPREGPNPREVSNAFFKRKQRLHYDHTPIMLGMVEFIMHDVTYSADSDTEFIEVAIPAGDEAYDPHGYGNATFKVWRTKSAAGTGTSEKNPRQHANEATAWLDCSALYGSTPEVVEALRSHVNGKLKSQWANDGFEYLPFNTEGLPVRTRPGVDIHNLFLGGDVRTNEDFIMLSVHTIFLREHNRLCDIVIGLHPDWDDERIYQTVKLVMGAKIALIGNSYQMAYWSDKMPWPRDDGFPLYRAMYGESVLEINPAHSYPWPLVTRNDRPMTSSAEMSIVYRFHEFIIKTFPVKDEHNNTLEERDLFQTAFDAKGFIDLGADNILRGMLASDIPNFKSGVEEEFRSAGRYRGSPFDIVTWSIVHEREQGLPTFNQYFEGYANMTPTPAVHVPIRKTFEDFSSDPAIVAELKRLYKSPDEVDLVVGVQLEENLFPGTTMPVSALIPSLFSLFGVGNSDRFSPGFAVLRCILVDKPWNCHPSNALEDLIWTPKPTKEFPNARWFDPVWMAELDLQAHGTNLLFRMITENSGAKCIQKNPLFPYNPQTNPVLCEPPAPESLISTILDLPKQLSPHQWEIVLGTLLALIAGGLFMFWLRKPRNTPPTTWGPFAIGVGQQLQKDPKGFIVAQAQKYGHGTTFGIRLFGSLVYYICWSPADLEVMKNDELRASFHALSKDTNLGALIGRRNWAEDLHSSLLRRVLETKRAETLPGLADVVAETANKWLTLNKLEATDDISGTMMHLMAYIMSRVCLGPVGFDDPELIEAFIGLNADSETIFQVSNLLPSILARIFSDLKVYKHFTLIKKKALPIIRQARVRQSQGNGNHADGLLISFLNATSDDKRVAELVGGIVVAGLINVTASVTNSIYDIAGVLGLQSKIVTNNLPSEFVADAVTSMEWNGLRSVVLETLRLSACVFSPVRKIVVNDYHLGANPKLVLPKNSSMAASPYLVHYDESVYPGASEFQPSRFAGASNDDAQMGTAKYLTFGLPGHTCPGRFFAIQTASIVLNALLKEYTFEIQSAIPAEKYAYTIGELVMPRKPVRLAVRRHAY